MAHAALASWRAGDAREPLHRAGDRHPGLRSRRPRSSLVDRADRLHAAARRPTSGCSGTRSGEPANVQKTSPAAACACSTTATASCSSALSHRGTAAAARAASRSRSSRGMAPSSRRALCAVSARAAGGRRRRPREPSRARAASLRQARRRPPAVRAQRPRQGPHLALRGASGPAGISGCNEQPAQGAIMVRPATRHSPRARRRLGTNSSPSRAPGFPGSEREIGWPRSGVWTCRRHDRAALPRRPAGRGSA